MKHSFGRISCLEQPLLARWAARWGDSVGQRMGQVGKTSLCLGIKADSGINGFSNAFSVAYVDLYLWDCF